MDRESDMRPEILETEGGITERFVLSGGKKAVTHWRYITMQNGDRVLIPVGSLFGDKRPKYEVPDGSDNQHIDPGEK